VTTLKKQIMKISVILCTYNRCESLSKALDSVLDSQLPESYEWELLVVDNNSSDKTQAVVENYSSRFPNRIRYIFEAQQGKSSALNRGILESKGEILVFMDDDVQVDPHWLCKISTPLQAGPWAGVGGRIIPPRDFSPPSWLPLEGPYSLGGILAFFDLGDSPHKLTEPPFGTNMAFRKETFERYGAFRLDLGPCPGTEIRGEDTEFGRRVLKAGEHLWYEPAAIVYHAVPQNRLEKRYFLRFLYDHGRALVREKGADAPVWIFRQRHITFLRLVFRRAPRRLIEWLLVFDQQQRFSSKCMVWMTFGQIAEIWKGTARTTRSSNGENPLRLS
jgi:glycosyltransferase involved in cell wall biosynthesis